MREPMQASECCSDRPKPENSESPILFTKMDGPGEDDMNWLRTLAARVCIAAFFAGVGTSGVLVRADAVIE
jgi:hypothetical protein